MAASSSSLQVERLFKVLVIGERNVGKSSIISRYVYKRFTDTYKTTIGVDFALKTIEWDTNTVVRLQLWDIAGQEWFKKMCRVYYKEAMGALVVFDITNRHTLAAALEWKRDLDSKVRLNSGDPIPAVLLANKCDKTDGSRELASTLDHFCKENRFLGWLETSAKDNINIDEAGAILVERMLQCDKGLYDRELHGEGIKVDTASSETLSQTACCYHHRS